MKKYLELFAQAIGMRKSVKRTRNELATTKGPGAKGWGRPIYSTSKEPSEDKETQTTKSETEPLDIHKQYHSNPTTHTGCCGFTECRTSLDNDIYILTGRKGS